MRRLFILLIIIFVFLNLSLVFAETDKILLKNGNFIEGKIISQDRHEIKIDIGQDKIMTLKPEYVKVFLKAKDIPKLTPKERYKELLKSQNINDAKTRLKIGNYCLKNGLLDYAINEFQEAEKLDFSYRRIAQENIKIVNEAKAENLFVISSCLLLNAQCQKALIYLNKIISDYPKTDIADDASKRIEWLKDYLKCGDAPRPMTEEDIKSKFEHGKVPLPRESEVEMIVNYLHGLKYEKERDLYAQLCLEKAQEFLAKAKSSKKHSLEEVDEARVNLVMAKRLCFIAYNGSLGKNVTSQEKLDEVLGELHKLTSETLIVPSYVDVALISSFIKNSDKSSARSFVKPYLDRAFELEETYEKEKDKSRKKETLEQILRCYEVAFVYYNNYQETPSKGWITLLYYGTKNKLKKL